MERVEALLEEIIRPPEEFTPIPFWFFNDTPDQTEIKRQLSDYVEKGVQGIVLHPRIGIPQEIPYLSGSYFDIVRFVVETASQLNIKVVLYDEGMYPSGSAHGLVAAENPAFASKGITIVGKPRGRILTELPGNRYLVCDFTGGTIRGIHFGEDDGEAGAPRSADILNSQAVEEFIRLTHDRYYAELKEFFGTTIIGFFTDEPCALGRNAGAYREWVEGLEVEIESAGGKVKELEDLFTGTENSTTLIYHKLIKKRLRETFYAPLSVWCEKHGIALMGHPEASDDVEEELYFQIPGQDLIMRRVEPRTGGLQEFDSVQAKLPADIARHLGRRRNANECFGVCNRDNIPWYFTGGDMKWYLDWLGTRGVNLFVPHAFYYSVEGKRKDERPPDVGPNNIWWKHYRRFSDYMKRLSYLMTDSMNGAKIAVLCDNNQVPCSEVAGLYENQQEFNYLPLDLLKECTVEDGCLCIRGYRYEVVLDVLRVGKRRFGIPTGINMVYSEADILGRAELKSIRTLADSKKLRAVHLVKDEIDMYFLSNEGDLTIREQITVPGTVKPVLVDLWRGTYTCIDAVVSAGTVLADIVLEPCETCLLVMGSIPGLVPVTAQGRTMENWNERFVLVSKEKNRAVYDYIYHLEFVSGSEGFEVFGEEMAECYCNGELADVSFWSPHCMKIGSYLREGENTVRLVMTGNAANIYSDANLFYGLKGEY